MQKLQSLDMNKRGQGEAIGVFILIGLILAGGWGSYKILSENRYVGHIVDSNTKVVYDLKYCDINGISNDKLISFSNLEEAHNQGFKDAPCNR